MTKDTRGGHAPRRVGVGPARKGVVVGVALLVAALHVVTGPEYGGPFRSFVTGYLIDIVLPFSMFLVLGLIEASPFCLPVARGVLVFAAAAVTETLQFLGLEIFGRTFDPLDYLAFALGVAGAWAFEAIFFRQRSMGARPGM